MDLWCCNTYIIIIFTFLMYKLEGQEILDKRCYLENGSNRETLIVPEDSPVGSIIGQLKVEGNPSPGGDIALHIEELKAPIKLVPGSKNLTLQHRLDKEGVYGPSSIFINVVCERLQTLDSGFIIPVSIRTVDVNDNYPIFVNAPYILNISEVTVVGTRVLRGVHATDIDRLPKFSTVLYSVLEGPNSDYFEFENEMEGTLVLKKSLDYEKLKQFHVKIRARDSGDPPKYSDTILTVNVLDADDQNPKFLDEKYSTTVPESTPVGTVLKILPKQIQAYDQDVGINATIHYDFVSEENDYKHFDIDKLSARVKVKRSLDSGHPTYPKTLVVRATQHDNPDRYALTTLTVSQTSLEGKVSFLKRTFTIVISEASPPCVVVGVLATNKPEEDLKYFVSDKEILKTFAINPRGEVALRKKLDYETVPEYYFRVFATDGITNDSASVNITIIDVNEWEPRFRYPRYEFFINNPLPDIIGKIEVKDGDKDDKLSLFLSGKNASIFYITSLGEIKLKDHFNNLKGAATFSVIATDDAKPPHSASVPVSVYFQSQKSSEIVEEKESFDSLTLLASLGTLLLFLAVVIFILVFYIMKSKRRSIQDGLLPSTRSHQSNLSNNNKTNQNIVNAFEEIPNTRTNKSDNRVMSGDRRKPSPKVHPAPQPPFWSPKNPIASPNKKLNWEDKKIDEANISDISLRSPPKLSDNMNLTVYF